MAKDEQVTRIAYDLGHGGDPALYLNAAGTLAQEYQLNYLELVQSNGNIISSAQWPAHFGYKEPAIASVGKPSMLKEEMFSDEHSETGLFAVRQAANDESVLFIVAGERLDSAFLSTLAAPGGSAIYLYRNSTPAFSSSHLVSTGTTVSDPTLYRAVIDRARSTGIQTASPVTAENKDGESYALTAVPLKAADGSVMAVFVIANSRKRVESQLAQRRIRSTAYSVAAVGILVAVIISLWIAARVSRPVELLAQAAREVAAGNWNAQVPVQSTDELGLLAVAFNGMTSELVDQRERLVQSERVAAWRELARRLAHELKNPLFPLQLTVENMIRARMTSPEIFEEVFVEGAKTLTDEISNLKAIIGRFSDFSKMPKPQVDTLDMRDVLSRVVRFYQPTLQQLKHPIEMVSTSWPDTLPVSVDAELMHRALSNLVLNAMDAMPEGGRLIISAVRDGNDIRISIADTGSGMTVEERERLFTPYYTTKQQGTGLGLAIVQSVIADRSWDHQRRE